MAVRQFLCSSKKQKPKNNMKKSESDKIKKAALTNAAALGLGGAVGALTKHAAKPGPGTRNSLAIQVGSAMGAAAAGGAGLGGSLAVGTAIVTAKVAVVVATGAAAAPFVLAAGVGYGLYRLFKKS